MPFLINNNRNTLTDTKSMATHLSHTLQQAQAKRFSFTSSKYPHIRPSTTYPSPTTILIIFYNGHSILSSNSRMP